MCDVLLVPDNRIEFCKNFCQIIFAGSIQCIFCFSLLALLIYINCKDILPVSYQKTVRGSGCLTFGSITGICQFVLLFVFFLNFIHHRCEIIGESQIIIILQAVQIKILASVNIGRIINRSSCLCRNCIHLIRKRIGRSYILIILVVLLCFEFCDGILHLKQKAIVGYLIFLIICQRLICRTDTLNQ